MLLHVTPGCVLRFEPHKLIKTSVYKDAYRNTADDAILWLAAKVVTYQRIHDVRNIVVL
jgi:hypothetical protein